ncbi:TPA: hypothetical protein UMB92_003157 [Stenotrophomonas maltophilia]|nr:hypothetical protein [Stenotrophomonas maltophilia]
MINPLLAALLCLPLLACDGSADSTGKALGSRAAEISGGLGQKARDATDEARRSLVRDNTALHAKGQPRAAITPDGQLLIDGRQVPTDAAQRRQLLDHRGLLIASASDRLDADQTYVNAADATLKGLFGGGGDVRKQVGDEYDRLENELKRICGRMPALLASQQALARDIPAFKAYATMTQNDVDTCGKGDSSLSIPFDD